MAEPKQEASIRQAKHEIARAMLALHVLKGSTISPSKYKQLAAIIVKLSDTRIELDKVDK